MCFGYSEKWAANFVDQPENGLTIRVARKHAVKSKEVFGKGLRVELQHTDQVWREFFQLIGNDHGAGQYLLRPL